jgi:hypothetical protein
VRVWCCSSLHCSVADNAKSPAAPGFILPFLPQIAAAGRRTALKPLVLPHQYSSPAAPIIIIIIIISIIIVIIIYGTLPEQSAAA